MARLSTGQSYGEADRQTSQRLVGGAEQATSGGELARQQMAQVAIQPQAAPVNTFQQVGTPTLGGPVKLFAPPDLPQPNQDLMALARSLGQFSTGLQDFYTSYDAARQKEAEAAGRLAAQELSRTYPGQQFVQIRDALYRKAKPADGSPGDPEAQRMLDRLQSLSPLQQAYTQRMLSRSVMMQALSTAQERFSRMGPIKTPDGREVSLEDLNTDDPLYQQAKQSLIPVISDPVVAQEFESQIYGMHVNLDSAHAKLRADKKLRDAQAAFDGAFATISSTNMPVENASLMLEQALNEARTTLGTEGYQRLRDSLPDLAKQQLEELARQPGSREKVGQMAEYYVKLFESTRVGPPGSNITLSQALGEKGGTTLRNTIVSATMAALAQDAQNDRTTDDSVGRDMAEALVAKYRLNENMTPADRGARMQQVMADPQFRALPPSQQSATLGSINTLSATGQMQTQINREESRRLVTTITYGGGDPTERMRKIDQLVLSGQVDPADVAQAYEQLSRQRERQFQPLTREVNNLLKDERKKLERHLSTGDRGQGLTGDEPALVNQYETTLREGVERILDQGETERWTPEKTKEEIRGYLKRQRDTFQSRVDLGTDTSQQARVPNVNTYRTNRGRNPELNAAVDSGVVLTEADYKRALEDWVEKGTMSPVVRQVIKDAGYGSNADQFFKKQWRRVYPGAPMPPQIEQGLNRLAGQQLSFNRPADTNRDLAYGFPPVVRQEFSLGRILNNSVNALLGGANAATRQPTVDPGQWNTGPAVRGSDPDAGTGWTIPQLRDEQGRPVLLSLGAANSFAAMIQDSGGLVRGRDVTSSQRTRAKNAAAGGAEGSRHLDGNAIDIHGASNTWMKRNGARYGWRYVDYPGTHGGHFEFVGGGDVAARPTSRTGGGMTGYTTYYTGGGGSDGVAGGPTANGERFDPRKLTAAVQWSLRDRYLNKWLIVEDINTGKTVRVWANDVGQMGGTERAVDRADPRIIDLSPAAFKALFGGLDAGKARIRIRIDRNQRRN